MIFKVVLVLCINIIILIQTSYCQDTIINSRNGRIKITKKRIGQVYDVSGQHQNQWITGRIKKVRYTYMYVRTYNGSTYPANPSEFYKPIKMTSYYYRPVSDIVIKFKNSDQPSQIYYLDSAILKSYYEDGTVRNVHFFDEKMKF